MGTNTIGPGVWVVFGSHDNNCNWGGCSSTSELIYYSTDDGNTYYMPVGKWSSAWNKINVIDDLKKEGFDAYLKNVPILLSESNGILSENGNIFPLAGISESTTILLNESGFYPIIKTDEHGFNNPRNLYKDNIDILIIGDSYAEGDGVNSNENIAAFIRKKGYKVISLGQNGNGPLIELSLIHI